MTNELKSYKPYARIVSIISGLVILLASLDASQVVQIFPEYASQINAILIIAGIIAPAIAQESRVVRAEEIVKDDASSEDIMVPVTVNMETDEIVSQLKEYVDEKYGDVESDPIETVDDGGA